MCEWLWALVRAGTPRSRRCGRGPMPRGANKGLARLAQIALRSHHQKFIKDVANDITRSATSMGISISGVRLTWAYAGMAAQ